MLGVCNLVLMLVGCLLVVECLAVVAARRCTPLVVSTVVVGCLLAADSLAAVVVHWYILPTVVCGNLVYGRRG